ncbi:hypothetical protein SEA_DMITRI_25 [Gordonia phage Dmitri]|nr:hypothetical protein SEA_DMITRI_25 [Gordonia phage Dmitri]
MGILWWRHEKDVERRNTIARDEQVEVSRARRQAAESLAAHSRRTSAELNHEVELNGFTEMMQKAWGSR